jgi:hypothetical protein
MALISNTGILTVTSAIPTWAQGASGTITVINSGTTVTSAALAAGAASYPGSSPADLCAPWCGGALVDIGGVPYLTVEGGGHTDGSWNGILKFGPLIGTNSPTWSVWFAASSVANVRENSATYADGKQCASHTYAQLVGVGSSLYEMQTTGYGSPGGDFLVGFRTTDGTPPTQASIGTITMGLHGATTYWNGKIYYIGGNNDFGQLRSYTVSGGAIAVEPNAAIVSFAPTALAADTLRGKALLVCGSGAYYWDLTTLSRRAVTGVTGNISSLEYDAVRDAFVVPVNGAAQVLELSASSLAAGNTPAWTTRSFTGTAPTGLVAAGTFGRWRYIPAVQGCILVPNSTSNVWFFKS